MAITTLLNTYGEEQQQQEHQQPPTQQQQEVIIPPLIDNADSPVPEEDDVPPPLDDPVPPVQEEVPLPIDGLPITNKPNITAIIRECLLQHFSEEQIRQNYMETFKTRYSNNYDYFYLLF